MLRRTLLFFAPAAAPAAGGAKGATAATGRRKKWIDRRSHKVRHNGKDVFNFEEQPACTLCHVRFRYRQDYQAHKQSTLHKERERWAEMMQWWGREGQPKYESRDASAWEWYRTAVAPMEAAARGVAVADVVANARLAQVRMEPNHSTAIDVPTVRQDIVEPRDQRWPMSPKA
jgi:hypothetical protein